MPPLRRDSAIPPALRTKLRQKPPEPLGWSNPWVLLTLGVAVVFDALRAFFDFILIAAPVLVGTIVAAAAAHSDWTSWIPSWITALAGAAVATAVELIPPVTVALEVFGVAMAMAVGIMGFLVMMGLFVKIRVHFFHAAGINFLRIILMITGSEVPYVNTLPWATGTAFLVLRSEIKMRKEAIKLYQADYQKALRQGQLLQEQFALARARAAAEGEEEVAAIEEREREIEREQAADGGALALDESFEPALHLATIKTLPLPERKEALRNFKETLADEKGDLAALEARTIENLRENPDQTKTAISMRYIQEAKLLGIQLTELQRTELLDAAANYAKRREFITSMRQNYPEDPEFFEALVGVAPAGPVSITTGPANINIRAENKTDYARMYYGADRNFTTEELAHLDLTGGFAAPAPTKKDLGNILTTENVLHYPTPESAKNVRVHEEQHAIRSIFKPQGRRHSRSTWPPGRESRVDEFGKKDIAFQQDVGPDPREDPSLSRSFLSKNKNDLSDAETRAADEILAYKADGARDSEKILEVLTKQKEEKGLYDYLHDARARGNSEGFRAEDVEKVLGIHKGSDHRQTLEAGIAAFDRMRKMGYPDNEIKALLTHEPLVRWNKVVDRLEQSRSRWGNPRIHSL